MHLSRSESNPVATYRWNKAPIAITNSTGIPATCLNHLRSQAIPDEELGIINPVMYRNDEISMESSPYSILKDLRLKNINRVIVGHININSMRNKFHMLYDMIRENIEILLISH